MFAELKIESYIDGFLISISFQAHLPEIKVHAYFAPVTPPPSVHGGGQRLCRCCIILWQWRARGGHLCLQVLLLWSGLERADGGGGVGERRGWTHSLLLIPDSYTDWSPPVPDQSNLPLLFSSSSQSCKKPRSGCGRCIGKQSQMDFCSLSASFFLSHCKDQQGHSTPWHQDSWRWARGLFEQYHTSRSNKQTKNTISFSRTLCVEYLLSQTHDSSVWPTFFLLCQINGSMEQEKSWIMEKAGFLSTKQ